MSVRESAKHLVKLLEKLPNDRVPHYASFKASQLDRFRVIAGLPVQKSTIKTNSKNLTDIVKDTLSAKPKPVEYKKELYNPKIVDQQCSSINNLLSSKYENTYKIGDKMLKPAGNPNYYTRLYKDLAQGGQQKESLFQAFRTVITGKY